MRRYPLHWDLLLGLFRAVSTGGRARVDELARKFSERLDPPAVVLGLENLPPSPRFVLAANHHQRPGLWIMHPASVLTHAIARHYRLGNPPVRWIVTANWPPLRLGRFRLPNPGDWLLPRVAHAFWAYPVPFAGSNPARTARSLRRLLSDARRLDRPIGLFPEGAPGLAGKLSPPLPGVERLLRHLGRAGLAAVPAAISEPDGLLVGFGTPIPCEELTSALNAAELVLARIRELLEPAQLDSS